MSVTVIGDAFIDIIVPVHGVKPGETYHKNIITQCGGTANVAMHISKLGEKSKFVGKVGNDVIGVHFRKNLIMNGVKDLTSIDDKCPTGLCVSMIYDDGERTMIANRGANDCFDMSTVESCIGEIIKSEIVYFSGYSILSSEKANSVLYAIEECRKHDCKVYFNPGAPNIIRENFKSILSDFVDVLILNEDEAKNIAKMNKTERIIELLCDIVDTAVITMGKDGCVVSKDGDYVSIPTGKMKIMDSTGAGDAFAAGFVVGKLRNMSNFECCKLGNETAANFLKKKVELLQ